MSEAYEEWVRVERTRLSILDVADGDERRGFLQSAKMVREVFNTLTKQNKKRRLLFARGRKEPVGPRKVKR